MLSFITVVLLMVFLHSNTIVTKTQMAMPSFTGAQVRHRASPRDLGAFVSLIINNPDFNLPVHIKIPWKEPHVLCENTCGPFVHLEHMIISPPVLTQFHIPELPRKG